MHKKTLYIITLLFIFVTAGAQITSKATDSAYRNLITRIALGDTTGLNQLHHQLTETKSQLRLLSLDGHLANATGNYEKARTQFTLALEINDTLSDAWLGRALANGRLGLFGPSRDDLSHLIKSEKPNAHIYKLRGLAALEMADYEAASADFTTGITIDESDNELMYLSALTHYKTDQYAIALTEINTAMKTDTTNAQYLYLRGSIQLASGANRKALTDYNQALTLRPDFADALAMKGYLYYLMGEIDQALITLKLATEADPTFGLPWYYTGLCQVEKELPSDALRSFDKASQFGYDDGDLYHYRGLAYIQLRRYDDACQAWKEAVLRGYRLSKALSRRYCQP